MKMVESQGEGWSQERWFLSAKCLEERLTWRLYGTLFCDYRDLARSTRVRFATNQHLASHPSCLLGIRRVTMPIVYARCAGLDVHKTSVVVCARLIAADGTLTPHSRSYGTTTAELLKLIAWLVSLDVTH